MLVLSAFLPLSKRVALLCLCVSVAQAQRPLVAGRVVDRNAKAPLAKVAVELIGITSEAILDTAVTGTDGVFTLVAPRAGAYRVRLIASAAAYVSDSLVVADGEYLTREFAIDASHRVFTEPEVDKGVVPLPRYGFPRYPDEMRARRISGCVLATFIVDTLGRADRGTLRIVSYSHREFVQSLWDAMPAMRFTPAQVRGRKVPQLVRQPFTFTVTGEARVECTPPEKKPSAYSVFLRLDWWHPDSTPDVATRSHDA
jgi:TonB family protein